MPFLNYSHQYQITMAAVCAVLLIAATITDINFRKIPNYITFPFIFAGLVLTGVFSPSDYFVKTVTLVILFFCGMTNVIGLGDIKLIMALCAIWHPFYALISVAVASVIIFIWQLIKNPKSTIQGINKSLLFLTGQYKPEDRTEKNTAPFAPYLSLAYILVQGGLCVWQILM